MSPTAAVDRSNRSENTGTNKPKPYRANPYATAIADVPANASVTGLGGSNARLVTFIGG
jgi:hypothetical protein